MGRTKALIEIDGTAMAARVAGALREAGCAPVLAYGGDPDELAPLGLAVTPDRYPGTGPLGGVLGLLEMLAVEHDDAVAFAVACDLPSLSGDVLVPMVEVIRRDPDLDVVVAHTSQSEPACAIWRVASHARLRALFDSGERALHLAIGALASTSVDVDPSAVRNINTPEELGRYP
jgi:molybdopterin-guanine dinucleotide biosynthesis protein A